MKESKKIKAKLLRIQPAEDYGEEDSDGKGEEKKVQEKEKEIGADQIVEEEE